MKYYKDGNNAIFAYEDDVPEFGTPDVEFTVGEGLIPITEEEIQAINDQPPTEEQIKETNKYLKNDLLLEANSIIKILQDIVDLGMQEADEEEQLKAWKKYRILLTRIDTDQLGISWPEKPE
ncbi:tail fiber assembly protein [Orbaceae bacterium ESL0721]|nr:tail fiber assembly protein [Orbaceae bacterium ESL0721]